MRCGYRRKSNNNREGSQHRNYDASSGSILRVRKKVFIEASKPDKPKNLKTSCARMDIKY